MSGCKKCADYHAPLISHFPSLGSSFPMGEIKELLIFGVVPRIPCMRDILSLSQRWRVTTEESGIKGVCLLTPVLPAGEGGAGHRHSTTRQPTP